MKQYEVRFRVDGRPGGSVIVEAKDSGQAKRIALGQIEGQPGYAGKRISIYSVMEIR